MKQNNSSKLATKKNGYQSDDDNVRYKLNTQFFNNQSKASPKSPKKHEKIDLEDDIRYKFPTVLVKPLAEKKPKQKIKVNFWSNKQTGGRLRNPDPKKEKTIRRHTVAVPIRDSPPEKPKSSQVVKVRKRVSFLPSPLFSDNHVPMVTVPDDLTIHLNEEEANDLGEDLNQDSGKGAKASGKSDDTFKRKSQTSTTQTSPKGTKRKHSSDDLDGKAHGNENDLEFFSKYVVQKLRKMETNQRIYSENLINTVLMLGQLAKLNGKSKILQQ